MSKVEVFENERASGYNDFVETWIPNYSYFMERLPRLLSEVPLKCLLVVGCGTGNEIEKFIQSSSDWEITGVDPSPEMIQQAQEKLKEYKNVHLIEGVLSDTDPHQKYSAAILSLVLHFLEDNGEKLSLLKDISARLEPGSPFIMLDITGDKYQIKGNLKILEHLLPGTLDQEQIKSRLGRIENDLHHVSENRLIDLCLEAGFEQPIRFFQSSIYMGWIAKKK